MDSFEDVTAALRPFMISPDSYQILRKLYHGVQPRDCRELCSLGRKSLICREISTCELGLTIAGKAIYEAATVAIEEAEREMESRRINRRAPVFTIAQLAAMALLLAAISCSSLFVKTLDATSRSVDTISQEQRNGAAIAPRKNQHEQSHHPDSARGKKGAPGRAQGSGLEYREFGVSAIAGQS